MNLYDFTQSSEPIWLSSNQILSFLFLLNFASLYDNATIAAIATFTIITSRYEHFSFKIEASFGVACNVCLDSLAS